MLLPRLGVYLTGGFVVVAAGISTFGFIVRPILNDSVSLPIFLVGFASAILSGALAMILRVRKAAAGPIPDRLFAVLFFSGLAAVVFAVVGIVITGGFSADNPAQNGCSWSISTDHGGTIRCVSHHRWLQVHDGVIHLALGVVAVFNAVICGLLSRFISANQPV